MVEKGESVGLNRGTVTELQRDQENLFRITQRREEVVLVESEAEVLYEELKEAFEEEH